MFVSFCNIAQTGGHEITITVIRPALDEDEDPERMVCTFGDEEDYKHFTLTQNGSLESNSAVLRFRDLKDNGVYTLGGLWAAFTSAKQQQRARDKVLEVETCLATETALGANAHTHYNVKIVGNAYDICDLAEYYDGVVVHSLKESSPNATAYIVESDSSPQEGHVANLLKKVEIFKQWAPSSPQFRSCVAFVPVFGGRNWSKATLDLCAAKKVSTVTPTGAGYLLFNRGFCTLLRRCLK
jgi:hypothetical protein